MNETDKVVEREYPRKCPECGEKIVEDHTRAETYCDSCGLIITENIVDLGPEWRSYDSEQATKRIRAGPPMSYRIYDKGLSVPIDKSLKKKEGRTGINTTKESIILALYEIDRMASALGLPVNIKEDASLLYRKAMEKKLIRGHSIEAITSAIIYIICRQYRVPRTFKEIKQVSWEAKEKKIHKAVDFLSQELSLKIPSAFPCDFVFRFCSLLYLSIETRAKVLEITNRDFNGRIPTGTVGAIIYIIAKLNNEPRTKKKIAKIAGVSVPTILNRSKEISKQLGINIPN